jgi:hypothetical protein
MAAMVLKNYGRIKNYPGFQAGNSPGREKRMDNDKQIRLTIPLELS